MRPIPLASALRHFRTFRHRCGCAVHGRRNRRGSARLLGYTANLMFFLVGWHYVKQGYGILILDSVQKLRFFPDTAKTVLRANGYVCWITAWLGANHVANTAPFAGFTFFTFPIPVAL